MPGGALVERDGVDLGADPPAQERAEQEARVTSSLVPQMALRIVRRASWAGLLAIVALLVVVPLVQIQRRAFESGAYSRMLKDDRLFEILRNTVALSAGSVAVALVLGTGLAWAAFNLPRRLRVLVALPMISIMLPPLAQVTGWVFLLSPRVGYLNTALRRLWWWSDLDSGPINVNTLPWIVIVTGIMLVPFVYIFVLTSLRTMDVAIFEAANVAGAGRTRSFFQVILPALRPALVYSATISLLLGFGQFTTPLILGRQQRIDVITTAMFRAANASPSDYPLAAAYGSPLIILGLIIIVMQRWLTRHGHRYQTLASRGHRPVSRGHWSAAIPILGYVFVAIVLPILGLLVVGLSPFRTGSIEPSLFSLDNFRATFADSAVRSALGTTVKTVVMATLVALPLALAVATALVAPRGPGRGVRGSLDVLASLPLTIPGLVFGVGILLAYTRGFIILYGSLAIFVVAYVTVVLPFVTRMLQNGLISAGTAMTEASRVSGAGAGRTQVFVVLPLVRGSIAAAVAISVALLSQEFAASVMVRSVTNTTLGPVLYDVYTQGFASRAAVLALLMCGVSAVIVSIVLMIGGRNALESSAGGLR